MSVVNGVDMDEEEEEHEDEPRHTRQESADGDQPLTDHTTRD